MTGYAYRGGVWTYCDANGLLEVCRDATAHRWDDAGPCGLYGLGTITCADDNQPIA